MYKHEKHRIHIKKLFIPYIIVRDVKRRFRKTFHLRNLLEIFWKELSKQHFKLCFSHSDAPIKVSLIKLAIAKAKKKYASHINCPGYKNSYHVLLRSLEEEGREGDGGLKMEGGGEGRKMFVNFFEIYLAFITLPFVCVSKRKYTEI